MAPTQPIHCYNYSENATTYLWNFGTESFSPNIDTTKKSREPVITYLTPGEYDISLRVWTDKGCTAYASLEDPIIVLGDLSTETGKNIQEGYMHIFAGAMMGIRNPKAHHNIEIDAKRAIHFLSLASLLMYKIDEKL